MDGGLVRRSSLSPEKRWLSPDRYVSSPVFAEETEFTNDNVGLRYRPGIMPSPRSTRAARGTHYERSRTSVLSDLAVSFEKKACDTLRCRLWQLFGSDAFVTPPGEVSEPNPAVGYASCITHVVEDGDSVIGGAGRQGSPEGCGREGVIGGTGSQGIEGCGRDRAGSACRALQAEDRGIPSNVRANCRPNTCSPGGRHGGRPLLQRNSDRDAEAPAGSGSTDDNLSIQSEADDDSLSPMVGSNPLNLDCDFVAQLGTQALQRRCLCFREPEFVETLPSHSDLVFVGGKVEEAMESLCELTTLQCSLDKGASGESEASPAPGCDLPRALYVLCKAKPGTGKRMVSNALAEMEAQLWRIVDASDASARARAGQG
eukprot:Rmarinus@m.20031